jgi:hypothetical protein
MRRLIRVHSDAASGSAPHQARRESFGRKMCQSFLMVMVTYTVDIEVSPLYRLA